MVRNNQDTFEKATTRSSKKLRLQVRSVVDMWLSTLYWCFDFRWIQDGTPSVPSWKMYGLVIMSALPICHSQSFELEYSRMHRLTWTQGFMAPV